MITIRDVARQAGVSVATVSRVLNNSTLVSADTREAVMKAVSELDYRPNANAQALATQVSDTIGVVVMDVSDAFFGALVKAVDLVAQQHQKYVLIGNSYHEAEKERHAIEVLIRQRCNASFISQRCQFAPHFEMPGGRFATVDTQLHHRDISVRIHLNQHAPRAVVKAPGFFIQRHRDRR